MTVPLSSFALQNQNTENRTKCTETVTDNFITKTYKYSLKSQESFSNMFSQNLKDLSAQRESFLNENYVTMSPADCFYFPIPPDIPKPKDNQKYKVLVLGSIFTDGKETGPCIWDVFTQENDQGPQLVVLDWSGPFPLKKYDSNITCNSQYNVRILVVDQNNIVVAVLQIPTFKWICARTEKNYRLKKNPTDLYQPKWTIYSQSTSTESNKREHQRTPEKNKKRLLQGLTCPPSKYRSMETQPVPMIASFSIDPTQLAIEFGEEMSQIASMRTVRSHEIDEIPSLNSSHKTYESFEENQKEVMSFETTGVTWTDYHETCKTDYNQDCNQHDSFEMFYI